MNTRLRSELLIAALAYHVRKDTPQTGGFDALLPGFIERTLADTGVLHGVAYETGAGL